MSDTSQPHAALIALFKIFCIYMEWLIIKKTACFPVYPLDSFGSTFRITGKQTGVKYIFIKSYI